MLLDATFFRPKDAPPGRLAGIYRAVGALRAGESDAIPYLEKSLAEEPPALAEPWLRLAVGELGARRYTQTETSLRRAAALPGGDTPLARLWLGLALAGEGRLDEALAVMADATAHDPDLVEAHFDRGINLLAAGRPADALPELQRATELRPTLAAGWLRLGEAREKLGRRADAIAAYRRALAIEPSTTDAYAALARALRASGDETGAREALAIGAMYARRPEALAGAEGALR